MPESSYMYRFTVFTPTYNRAYCLADLYNSLTEQTFKDFEWLIVDDGSTDNTEELINSWIQEGLLPIRFIKQPNGGKHRATNAAVPQARGQLFLTIDSDDTLFPEALSVLSQEWSSLPEERKKEYQGVTCVNVDPDGNIIGGGLPEPRIHCRSYELRYKMGYCGDMTGFTLTDILKQFPFPEFDGEKFLAEGVAWLRIDREYITLFANIPIKRVYYRNDGLTANRASNALKNPMGIRAIHKEMANLPLPLPRRLRSAANYVRFSLHARAGIVRSLVESGRPLLVLASAPIGYAAYVRDRLAHRGKVVR